MINPPPPLEYSHPAEAARPGMVTAIGILSIVVGCLSGLTAASGVFSAAMYIAIVRFMPAAAFPAIPPPPPAGTTMPATAPAGVMFHSTTVTYNASGAWAVGGTGATTAPATAPFGTPPPAPVANPFVKMSVASIAASGLASLIGVVIAIGLFVLGILVLRGSRPAIRMHWYYLLARIPQAVLVTAASSWMMWEMMQGVATLGPAGAGIPGGNAGMMGMMAASMAFNLGIALAYPVGLIFALRSRAVREYAADVRAAKSF